MKIKKIKEIKNIGTFAQFLNGGSLGFEKLTFIYGLNTFGKTTITDIFQSLKENNPEIILSRKTIPIQTIEQKVILSIQDNNIEKDVIFKNNSWEKNEFQKYLEIFGTEFIHKNLFTGFSIERNNKENFTQFILGEEGVLMAKKIGEDKKNLGDKKRNLSGKVPNYIKNKNENDIKKFLDFDISLFDLKKIDTDLLKLKKERQDEDERLKEPKKILDLEIISEFAIPEYKILQNIEDIDILLQQDYSAIKEETLKKVEDHINKTFKDGDGAENWIKKGFNNCKNKDGDCVFCGQSLQDAHSLITAYDSYFDVAYSNFISDIESKLTIYVQSIEDEKINSKTTIVSILATTLKYKDLIGDDKFQGLLLDFDKNLKTLDEEGLIDAKNGLIKGIKNKVQEKNKKPYIKVGKINSEQLGIKLKEYGRILGEIQSTVLAIKKSIDIFRKQYEDIKSIQDKVLSLSGEIEKFEYQKIRIDQDKECRDYLLENSIIVTLDAQIKLQEQKLKENQNIYLSEYFGKINKLFEKFGSQNFILENHEDNKGYQPVYSLKVKFHGEEINNEQLKTVFSESDRRALALAIFWTKIELKTVSDKQKTVVVLDDPITSFDDNRIFNSINLFKESLEDLSQIIILTHYPHFIKNFCERTKESVITTKIFTIQKNMVTSVLVTEDKKTFTDSQYEKTFTKIYGFIQRNHNNCIKTDLRPFLENLYIPTFFPNQLRSAADQGVDISSLEKQIDAIFQDQDIKDKFHGFRQNLNPESHIFTSSNEEDIRNFAQEMINFLYSFQLNTN